MEVSREEMLEFGKMATFRLDDRLVPFDRETLRAEAWFLGHEMSKRFPLVSKDQQEMEMQLAASQCELKEVREELQQVDNALKEETAVIAQEVEIVLDGVRHRLINNPAYEHCSACSLDKVCDRFKDAICNVFKGQSGCHIFQKVGEE